MAQITMENVVYVKHTPAPGTILIPYFSSISTKRNALDAMSANPTALLEPFLGKPFEPHEIRYTEGCINCGQCLTHCP